MIKPFEGLKNKFIVYIWKQRPHYLCQVFVREGRRCPLPAATVCRRRMMLAAALADSGISVFAYHGATDEEYSRHIEMCLEHRPNIIIDDGGDLVENAAQRKT